jgi:peptide/nickel transport system substrate-binding protein
MSDRENTWIPKLKEQLAGGLINRREFIRYTTLLGMSATAAYMWAGKITGQPFAPPVRAAEMPTGGKLRIGMRCAKIADPHTYSWIYDSNVYRQVGGYLTRTAADNLTRPDVAESWSVSDDLRTWEIKIRNINWHSGRRVTAEDAAWNINRVLQPETGSSVLGLMKGYMLEEYETGETNEDGSAALSTRLWDSNAIEVVDESTLRLNLKQAQVAVPEHLFHYPMAILDPEEGGSFGPGSNGMGAFDLLEYDVGRRGLLRARSDYWGDGPYIDELEYIDLGDNASANTAALQSGQIDGIYEGNVEQLSIYQDMEHVEIYEAVTANTGILRMQVDRPEFQDPRVRKAVRLAIDTPKVLEFAYNNLGQAGEHHHVCQIHPEYAELAPMTRDVEAAKALLAEAGHPDGVDIGGIACKADPTWELTAVETMVSQLAGAGITARVELMPSAKYWEVWDKAPFGFTPWAHRPLGFMVLALAYRSGVPWNESHFNNAEFDTLLSQAEGTLDVDDRRAIIAQLETIMQEEGPMAQPLWQSFYVAYDKKVVRGPVHPTGYIFGEEMAIQT